MRQYFTNLLADDSGQDLVEYGLLACLIGLGAIASIRSMATSLSGVFASLGNALTSAT